MKTLALGAVTILLGLSACLAARISVGLRRPLDVGIVLAAAGFGLLATDAISGLVHWFCDNYFEEDTPLLGPALIAPFRAHHRDPRAMTRHNSLTLNLSNWLVALPFLAVTVWAGGACKSPRALFGTAFVFFFAHAVAWTNQFHLWAHLENPPRLARALQAAHLAIPPSHHANHHRAGHAIYCITVGWLNPPLDKLGFFARVECWIAALGSTVAAHGTRQHGNHRQNRPQEGQPVAAHGD